MKKLITNYTFTPASRTITFNDFNTTIDLKRVLIITNVDTGAIIYNFADPNLGGTVAGKVLTLEFDTTGMASNANLQIWYELSRMEKIGLNLHSEELVETERQTFREDFDGVALDAAAWDVLQQGAGQTINVASSTLNIGAGVAINEVVRIRSKKTFTLPFRAQFTAMLSQRIVNQTFYLEVVNAAGTTFAQWLFDGATATAQKIGQAHVGISNPASPAAVTTTNSTAAQATYELDLRADGIEYNERVADAAGAATNRATRTRTIPEPGEEYYLQIRAVNGGVAPASNTTLSIDIILVQDVSKLVAEMSAGRATNAASRAIGAFIVNSVGVTLTSTLVNPPSTSATTSPAHTPINVLTPTVTSANATNAKASVGKLTGFDLFSKAATVRYLKFYNTATLPTMGTTAAIFQIPLAPGRNFMAPGSTGLAQFALGMAYAITEGPALNDNTVTNVAANDIVGTLYIV